MTNNRVVRRGAGFADAWTFAEAVRARPTHRAFVEHADTLGAFARFAGEASATGNLVTDAYIAATAAPYGGTVVTFDRDLRKFDGPRVKELTACSATNRSARASSACEPIGSW